MTAPDDGLYDDFIRAKYGGGGPGGDRFEDRDDEIHTSRIAECQRKLYWDRRRGGDDDPSVYFELGRVFELMYGGALAWRYGDLDRSDLQERRIWELAELAPRVWQDVGIEIELEGGVSVPGESDWVVLFEDAVGTVEEHGRPERCVLHRDGSRSFEWADGHVQELDEGSAPPIERVIETKTKNDLSKLDGPQTKHLYQLVGYTWAFGAPGTLSYTQRDDLELAEYDVGYDKSLVTDARLRVLRHASNLRGDELPAADPPSKWSCYYCPHRHDCADARM